MKHILIMLTTISILISCTTNQDQVNLYSDELYSNGIPMDPVSLSPLYSSEVDERIYNVPTSIEQRIKRDSTTQLPLLVEYLQSVATSEEDLVILMHDWIAIHISYDVDAWRTGRIYPSTGYSVLETGSSVCSGYSSLMQEMCDLAGIECITIEGYGRGFGASNDIERRNGFRVDHAWNSIKIDGQWKMVDTTWDAGYVDGYSFFWNFSRGYCLLDPEDFIYTHYPQNPNHQMLDKPISWNQFLELPYLYGLFFQTGTQATSRLPNTLSGEPPFQLEFDVPVELYYTSNLVNSSGQNIENSLYEIRGDGSYSVLISPPTAGEYTLNIFAKKENEDWDYLGSIPVITNQSGSRFPTFYSDNVYELITPLTYNIKSNVPQRIELIAPEGYTPVIYSPSRHLFELSQTDSGTWYIELEIEPGIFYIGSREGDRISFFIEMEAKL